MVPVTVIEVVKLAAASAVLPPRCRRGWKDGTRMLTWWRDHGWWVAAGSLAVCLGGLSLVYTVLVRLPANYFIPDRSTEPAEWAGGAAVMEGGSPRLGHTLLRVLKNVLGV